MSLTIAIIGNTNHNLMEFALEKTIRCVPHDEILVFCDKPLNLTKGYKHYKIPESFSLIDYCHFCVKELNQYVKTDFCMTIQYDGFATNKNAWTDDFLKYDCIGPLISPKHPPMEHTLLKINTKKSQEILKRNEWRTGGGGFNIKSKKFLEICANESKIIGLIPTIDGRWACDDLELTYYYDEIFAKNNIKFAPVDLSLKYSIEITTGYNFCLGFHGWYNSPLLLNEEEVIYFIQNLKRKKPDPENGLFLGFLLSRGFKKAFNFFKDNND